MTPRTGCSAVGKALIDNCGGIYIPEQHILDNDGHVVVDRKHCTIQQLLDFNIISQNELNHLTSFTFIRNPFDSLVSLYVKQTTTYQDRLKDRNSWIYNKKGYLEKILKSRDQSFDEWILDRFKSEPKKPHNSFQSPFRRGVDYVLKYEQLQEDIDALFDHLCIKKISIPIINKTTTKTNHYRDYYSKRSRRVVRRALRNTLAKYNYSF